MAHVENYLTAERFNSNNIEHLRDTLFHWGSYCVGMIMDTTNVNVSSPCNQSGFASVLFVSKIFGAHPNGFSHFSAKH